MFKGRRASMSFSLRRLLCRHQWSEFRLGPHYVVSGWLLTRSCSICGKIQDGHVGDHEPEWMYVAEGSCNMENWCRRCGSQMGTRDLYEYYKRMGMAESAQL